MPPIPFLDTDAQERFLHDHHMIDDEHLSPKDKNWLMSINFHHLLGYAKNYRALIGRGQWKGPRVFSSIRSVVEAEFALAAFLTPWLRTAEMHLRSLTVKHFCDGQLHGEGFLDTSHWDSNFPEAHSRLQRSIIDSILSYREPYVVDHLERRADERGISRFKKYDSHHHTQVLELVRELPLWSVIDSFSAGTLGKFIMMCGEKPSASGRKQPLVWEAISQSLGISKSHLGITLDAFANTRNLVFHHQRLWMRPMVKSPGIPNELERRYQEYSFKMRNKQAQFIALMTISRLLPTDRRAIFLSGLEKAVHETPLYAHGIMGVPFTEQSKKRSHKGLTDA